MKNFILIICLLLPTVLLSQNLVFNGDFELGSNLMCHCPTGFSCNNDAGRVVDGVHPLFIVTGMGCLVGGTNYTNSLGAHSGTGYVYFYAGGDRVIITPNMNFDVDAELEICVWYAGPQGQGALDQNTNDAHFSLAVDGVQVGPDVLVPVGTPWTQHCLTVNVAAGSHNFGILTGWPGQYSIWLDDLSVKYHCPNPLPSVNLGNDTTLCEGETLTLDVSSLNATYLWQDSSSNSTYNITEQGTYWTEVSVNNCSAADTVNVTVATISVTIEEDGDLLTCPGNFVSYQWYLNDEPLQGETSQTFTASVSGNYVVEVTDANGCTGSSYNLEYTSNIGILENERTVPFKIFPNPSRGTIYLQMETMQPYTVEVLNALGQQVYAHQAKDEKELAIELATAGVYHLRVSIADAIYVVKAVKE